MKNGQRSILVHQENPNGSSSLAVLVALRSCTPLIARRMRQVVAAVVGSAVLSIGGSAAWGVPVPTSGDGWDGPGLGSADLTYYFGTPTADVTIEAQQRSLVAALGVWSSVAAVTFSQTSFASPGQSTSTSCAAPLLPSWPPPTYPVPTR
jgi:hypothetical protein